MGFDSKMQKFDFVSGKSPLVSVCDDYNTSIVATLLDLGGFARALGYIALTASLNRIMPC